MKVPEIAPKEAAELLKKDSDVKLIDVRTDEEYAAARIPGSLLVNTNDQAAGILAWPRETPIIVHCHHGPRSHQAAAWLLHQGFTKVFNLAGGIDAWSTEVDPSVPRY